MKKKPPQKLFTFEVLVPCVYSEIYWVEAKSAAEALDIVRKGEGTCLGESVTGTESEGFRVKELRLIKSNRRGK